MAGGHHGLQGASWTVPMPVRRAWGPRRIGGCDLAIQVRVQMQGSSCPLGKKAQTPPEPNDARSGPGTHHAYMRMSILGDDGSEGREERDSRHLWMEVLYEGMVGGCLKGDSIVSVRLRNSSSAWSSSSKPIVYVRWKGS